MKQKIGRLKNVFGERTLKITLKNWKRTLNKTINNEMLKALTLEQRQKNKIIESFITFLWAQFTIL